MIKILYERMGLPESAHLGKRIYKKMLHENAGLSAADKKTISEDIETITWAYTLKPSTIPIRPFVDEECEYIEIAVIQADLKARRRAGRIAEIIHRAILATKRFSQSERGAIVADEFFATDWIDLEALNASEESFLNSLSVRTLPHTDFKAFYDAWVDRVFALDCAARTGHYVPVGDRREAGFADLAACRDLESRIAEERAALKKETQFNRQVEHNVRIKQMEKELEQKVAAL